MHRPFAPSVPGSSWSMSRPAGASRDCRPALHAFLCGSVGLVLSLTGAAVGARATDVPKFIDGQAQVVEGFADARQWVRDALWVETEFDSDGDGRRDRVFVNVTRPSQTEQGLKVPVVYETSPYYAATGSNSPNFMWNPRHELDVEPQPHDAPPAIPFNPNSESVARIIKPTTS